MFFKTRILSLEMFILVYSDPNTTPSQVIPWSGETSLHYLYYFLYYLHFQFIIIKPKIQA